MDQDDRVAAIVSHGGFDRSKLALTQRIHEAREMPVCVCQLRGAGSNYQTRTNASSMGWQGGSSLERCDLIVPFLFCIQLKSDETKQ